MRRTCSSAHLGTDLEHGWHEYTNVADRELQRRGIEDALLRNHIEAGPASEHGRRTRLSAARLGVQRGAVWERLVKRPRQLPPSDQQLDDVDMLALRPYIAALRTLWPGADDT